MKTKLLIAGMLLITAMLGLTSCSVYLAGQPIAQVPNYFSGDTWVEFQGRNPQVEEPQMRRLEDGDQAELWQDRGHFWIHGGGAISRAFYSYRYGAGYRPNYWNFQYDGQPQTIMSYDWYIPITNSQDGGERILTITVYYLDPGQPERKKEININVHSNNLREVRR